VIIGIGVDTVDIGRFERQIERTPRLLARLFAEPERALPLHSLAARFAAKEALIKALGGDAGLSWQDLAIVRGEDRVPGFAPTAALVRVLGARGAGMPHVSMTHDGGMATAFVVLETGDAAVPGSSLEAEAEQDGA